MKKIALMLCACAALSFGFSSCEKDPSNGNGNGNGNGNTNFDEVVEDGFYVAGAATGSEQLTADYMMAAGLNEVTKEKRNGMYEKYVALEANKDFSLLLYEAGAETRYSAKLEEFNTNGENEQPNVTLWRGALVTGADAPSMQVAVSGLYHIVLDLNKAGDLANPQIIVAPVQWGTRGINDDWGFKPLGTPEFNRTSMTFKLENVEVTKGGKFKFAYGGGWKIQLDDAGNVKANTNLGNDATEEVEIMSNALVPNGKDIAIKRGIYTIELTWNLASGDIKKSYVGRVTKTGDVTVEKPDFASYNLGITGTINGMNWDGDVNFTYDAANENWYIENFTVNAGEIMKIRQDGGWNGVIKGYSGLTFLGDPDNFKAAATDDNIEVIANATYKKVVLTWDYMEDVWTIDFQK